MAPPQGSSVFQCVYGKLRHAHFYVLILGMQHHLVDLYQVCSNYTHGAKNGPVPVVKYFTKAYLGKT